MFLFRFLRRLIKALIYLVVIVILVPVAGLIYGLLTTDSIDSKPLLGVADEAPPAAIAATVRAAIPGYQRPEEATFLAYPEWAMAYAARDYAEFTREHSPSGFPYWSYIARFWQDYAMVIRASDAYPFDFAEHRMPVVIGTGQTIECVVQWAYENTVGRITGATADGRTAADDYLAEVAAEYAAFLVQTPWYEFPYAEKRAGLMALQRKPGDDPVRTGERRWAFSLAWSIEQGYAGLVGKTLAPTPDPADIHVWVKGPIGEAVRSETDALLERDLTDDGVVFVTKRHQAFTDMIPRLIDKGVTFVEIGGNDEIMMTVLSAASVTAPEGSRVLFDYEVPADPTRHRTALVVAVRKLHTVLPALLKSGARLEHVYDY